MYFFGIEPILLPISSQPRSKCSSFRQIARPSLARSLSLTPLGIRYRHACLFLPSLPQLNFLESSASLEVVSLYCDGGGGGLYFTASTCSFGRPPPLFPSFFFLKLIYLGRAGWYGKVVRVLRTLPFGSYRAFESSYRAPV